MRIRLFVLLLLVAVTNLTRGQSGISIIQPDPADFKQEGDKKLNDYGQNFIPLSTTERERISTELKALLTKYPKHPIVYINISNCSSLSKVFAKEVFEILNTNGVIVRFDSLKTMRDGTKHSVAINGSSSLFLEDFLNLAYSFMASFDWETSTSEAKSDQPIQVDLNGAPWFARTGHVLIK